jgi:hypothetical protein
MTKTGASCPRVLLCVLAALGAMGCTSQGYPTCPDGGLCTLLNPGLPWTSGGYACTPPLIPCDCTSACNGPRPCPLYCPDAGTDNLCPQGLVCKAGVNYPTPCVDYCDGFDCPEPPKTPAPPPVCVPP